MNYIECCPQKRSCNCKVKYKLKSQALIKGRHLKRPFLTTFGTLTHSSFSAQTGGVVKIYTQKGFYVQAERNLPSFPPDIA